jgi:HEAT repeat protein
MLRDKDAYVKSKGIEILGNEDISFSYKTLMQLWDSKNKNIREQAISKLLESYDEIYTRKNLFKIYKIGNASQRYQVIEHLYENSEERFLKENTVLFKKALNDKDSSVRKLALEILLEIGDVKYFDSIEKTFLSRGKEGKLEWIQVLRDREEDFAFKKIVSLIKDADIDVQTQVIFCLGKMESEEASNALLSALTKKIKKKAHILILKALKNCEEEKILPILKEDFKNKDVDIRCYIMAALKEIESTDISSFLDDGLLDDNSAVRSVALDILQEKKGKTYRDVLMNHFYRELEKTLQKKTRRILKKNFGTDKKVIAFFKDWE